MKSLYFITGGQRSGKSRYAQNLAKSLSEHPTYLATSRIWDDEHKKRIERHQADRGAEWTTLEEDLHLSRLNLQNHVVVLDCITLWLTNIFNDTGFDAEKALQVATTEFDKLTEQECVFIIISNEIGMGVIPESPSVRRFVDLQGWMNQHIAKMADSVTLMVSGIPVCVK
jgi:adenosylcobinamide kinase/adenosylcobinamide-phosphate guanylyltransferase